MASSNRHWPSMFKSKPCNGHQQWQHHDINASSLLPSGFKSPYTSGCEERSPDPKPRWNPKPEQIRILEAIFNSGMVNPPRDEIRKIRTQLQEYGHVGDANVFYWFQNRKSRSKNKHRHVFHSTTRAQTQPSSYTATSSSSSSNSLSSSASNSPMEMTMMTSQAYGYGLPKKVEVHHGYGGETTNGHANASTVSSTTTTTTTSHANETQGLRRWWSNSSALPSEDKGALRLLALGLRIRALLPRLDVCMVLIVVTTVVFFTWISSKMRGARLLNRSTVFINELAFDVIASPLNLRELFGEEAILLHSSGYPVFTDELGVTLQPLQHGASYYLI